MTLDFVLDRVRVTIFGAVDESPPCVGAIQGARVEIVDGPDAGTARLTGAAGYQLNNINWGRFRLRASKAGYVPVEVTMDVLSPGSSPGGGDYVVAPSRVPQDFRVQRTSAC